MQATRCLLHTSCELISDQTKNIHFRAKLRNLQYVNKTPCLYVQQGKSHLLIFENSFKHEYLFTLMILFRC